MQWPFAMRVHRTQTHGPKSWGKTNLVWGWWGKAKSKITLGTNGIAWNWSMPLGWQKQPERRVRQSVGIIVAWLIMESEMAPLKVETDYILGVQVLDITERCAPNYSRERYAVALGWG